MTVAEVSGDRHAAQLAAALREMEPTVQLEGIGGSEMQRAGVHLTHETVRNAAMGWRGALRAVELGRVLRAVRERFRAQAPDVLVCVDSPSLNLNFARMGHKLGIPVLCYVAPQLWAWREGRMKLLRKWVDHLACILPFEEAYFRAHGVKATFVGHPLFDALDPNRPRMSLGTYPQSPPVIGLLAGSRRSEAAANFEAQLEVARRLAASRQGIKFLCPTTQATDGLIRSLAETSGLVVEVGLDRFDEMVPLCDLCLTVSGTATLHVASFGVPMVVVYRGSRMLWHTAFRWMIRTRTFALVNLLAGREARIVPEFVPWFGPVDDVVACMNALLDDPEALRRQRQALRELVDTLDHPGASRKVAGLVMELAGRVQPVG
jgi:lipid-A-disaccharide synthase